MTTLSHHLLYAHLCWKYDSLFKAAVSLSDYLTLPSPPPLQMLPGTILANLVRVSVALVCLMSYPLALVPTAQLLESLGHPADPIPHRIQVDRNKKKPSYVLYYILVDQNKLTTYYLYISFIIYYYVYTTVAFGPPQRASVS